MDFTEEEDVFAFLGVEVNRDGDKIILKQRRLIDKVIKTVDMEDANLKHTPAESATIGSDTIGEKFEEKWRYSSLIGMLLYLC